MMSDNNVQPIFITAEFVRRCLDRLVKFKRVNAPSDIAELAGLWFEFLHGYTVPELNRAFKEIVRTAKFFPDISEIIGIMDSNRYGDAEQKYAEFVTLLREYSNVRNSSHGHRNCDEILGRVIEQLGGLYHLKESKSVDGGVTRKQFSKLYADVVEKYHAGYYRDKPAPMVGSHTALAVGSDPKLLLQARQIPPKLPESITHEQKKQEHKKAEWVPLTQRLHKIEENQEPGAESPDDGQEKEKLGFYARLWAIAEQEQPEDCSGRDLNATEIASLKFCLANNPKLVLHRLINPAKGYFQRSPEDFGGFIRYFDIKKDPLHDRPETTGVIS